jgi:predicted transcriptional regulator
LFQTFFLDIFLHIVTIWKRMKTYSTREAAKKLGLTHAALSKYIKAKKIPPPEVVQIGRLKVHSWSESDIKHVRELLPKIANGRKTRHQKQPKKQTTRKAKR